MKQNLRINLNILKVAICCLLLTSSLLAEKNNMLQAQKEFNSIREYETLKEKNDIALEVMDSLGYLWTTKGVFYFNDYVFDDGKVKSDLNKAEMCFSKAIERGDSTAYYLLAATKLKQGKPQEARDISLNRLKIISKYKSNNKLFKRDYSMLANMYAGLVLEYFLNEDNAKEAITYVYSSAHKDKNNRSELYIGMLYKYINKKEISDYFLYQACVKNEKKVQFVEEYCKDNLQIRINSER